MRKIDPSMAIIATSWKGYLAKSKVFKSTVKNLHYKVKKTNVDFFEEIIDLLLDQVNATITTDGKVEVSGSLDVQQVANSHGYEINATVADASS